MRRRESGGRVTVLLAAALMLALSLAVAPGAGASGDVREKSVGRQERVQEGEGVDRPTALRQADFADVKYGPHERNVLDFWKAESEKPAPVLLYFHGGGFVGGDKRAVGGYVERCLAEGISVASANYRFVRGREPVTFPGPHRDGARVVQFLRHKSKEWNITPDRIALVGSSAGANMALWIGLHDDLADPESEDPVARLSSRVSCVVSHGGQTSNDPRFILERIGGSPRVHPSLFPAYGVSSWEELDTPDVGRLVEESSAISHATAGDPAVYLAYGGFLAGTPLPKDTPIGVSIHHAMFGKVLKEKLDPLGVECHLYYK